MEPSREACEPGYDVVIVHYNGASQVADLVRNIEMWSQGPGRIVVVDNSCNLAGDDQLMTTALAKVEIVESHGNPGYGTAVNVGLRHLGASSADYVLIATQEVSASPVAVENLLRCLRDHPEAAVAAPLLVFRSEAGKVFSAGGMVDAKCRTYHAAFRASVEHWRDRPDFDVAWADGAFLMVRKSALAVSGLFREDLFLYFEEFELQLRLRLQGWSVRLVPAAVCAQEPGHFTAYLRVRNRMLLLTLFPHYFDRRVRFTLLDVMKVCAISLRDGRLMGVLWAWRGFFDGSRGVGGKPPRRVLGRRQASSMRQQRGCVDE